MYGEERLLKWSSVRSILIAKPPNTKGSEKGKYAGDNNKCSLLVFWFQEDMDISIRSVMYTNKKAETDQQVFVEEILIVSQNKYANKWKRQNIEME